MVLCPGRRPDDPSLLPLAYGTNLIGVLAVIGLFYWAAVLVAAYRGGMGRTVLTVLGVLLAIWLVVSVIGAIISSLKFFFIMGLVVLVIMGVVTMIGRSSKSYK